MEVCVQCTSESIRSKVGRILGRNSWYNWTWGRLRELEGTLRTWWIWSIGDRWSVVYLRSVSSHSMVYGRLLWALRDLKRHLASVGIVWSPSRAIISPPSTSCPGADFEVYNVQLHQHTLSFARFSSFALSSYPCSSPSSSSPGSGTSQPQRRREKRAEGSACWIAKSAEGVGTRIKGAVQPVEEETRIMTSRDRTRRGTIRWAEYKMDY